MITRFAPSPTGPLHLGHAYSALLAHDTARAAGGKFLLRIDDLDQSRSRQAWEDQIYEDLAWLGITWDAPPLRQSARMDRYRSALASLWDRDLLFPCICTRKDIEAAISAPQEGAEPAQGPDGLLYPGTCRTRAKPRVIPDDTALRLDTAKAAIALGDEPLGFVETGLRTGTGDMRIAPGDLVRTIGDVVLARRDFGASYHLSVVLDDADSGVTDVIRGQDLFDATTIHVVLQHLLSLPTPGYHHHRLIRDEHGKRLAKRDDARAIATFRAEGATPAEIREMVGL